MPYPYEGRHRHRHPGNVVGVSDLTELRVNPFKHLERFMPNFTNGPPTQAASAGLRLVRTPPAGKLTAIITCQDLVGCPTHFYQRRTIPCESPNCAACDAGHAWRWHGYVTATDIKTNEHFIFEMTAQAAEPFTEYKARHKTLLGCLFEASRLGDHHNGRVLIRCKPANLTQINIPKAPDVIGCLCHIWNIPRPEAAIEGTCKQNARIAINRNPDGNGRLVPITTSKK